MKTSTLHLLRWILLIICPVLFIALAVIIDNREIDNEQLSAGEWVIGISLAISTIALFVSFIYKRTTITYFLKKFLIFLIPFSVILIVLFNYLIINVDINDYISAYCVVILILSLVLSFIIYLEKIESILIWMIIAIVFGFVFYILGFSSEGQLLLIISFGYSTFGFLYLSFKSIKLIKENKAKGGIFVSYYCIIGILSGLFLIIFSSYRPDLKNIYDKTGVIIFLLACLALFISLPFSDFIEWSKQQKVSFKRLILLPFVIFLIIFSIRFLLPESSYRKIFSRNLNSKDFVHFSMQDYKVEFKNR